MSDSPVTFAFDKPLVGSLSAEELWTRWTATSELQLYRYVMWKRLPAYLCRGQDSAWRNNAGEEIYDCFRGGAPHIAQGQVKKICWDFTRFDMFSVRFYERRHADTLFETEAEWLELNARESSTLTPSAEDDQLPTVTYDECCGRLQLPPEDVDSLFEEGVFTLLDPVPDLFPLDDRPVYRVPLRELEEYTWERAGMELVTAEALAGGLVEEAPRPPEQVQQPVVPSVAGVILPETPERFAAALKANGVLNLKQLAGLVDERFKNPNGKTSLSDFELGQLLPSPGGRAKTWEAYRSQGRRLRGKK